MKKTLSVLIALLLCMALVVGCAPKQAPAETQPSQGTQGGSTPAPSAPAQTTPAAPDPKDSFEPITFSVGCSYKDGSAYVETFQAALDSITEKTDGKINFILYTSNQLGSSQECIEQMANGANVMAGSSVSFLAGYELEAEVPALPYLCTTTDELKSVTSSEWWHGVEKSLADNHNIVPVVYMSAGFRNTIGKVAVSKPDDLKGHIFRIGLGTIGQSFVKAAGGTPTTTSTFTECYSALQTNMFDLCEADLELLYNNALYEVSNYLSVTQHMMNPSMYAVNAQVWNSIPEDYQKIIKDELLTAGEAIFNNAESSTEEMIGKFEEKGVKVVRFEDVDVEAFRALLPDILEMEGIDKSVYDACVSAMKGN